MLNKKQTRVGRNAVFSPTKHFPAQKLTIKESTSLGSWLIRFSLCDLSTIKEKDWMKLRKEFTAFIKRSIGLTEFKYSELSQQNIQNLQTETKGYFDNLRDGYNCGFQLTSEHHFSMKDEKLVHDFRHEYSNPPYAQAFFFTLTNIGDRFRVCQNDKCRNFFVAMKRQGYCSPTCSQSVRLFS